MLFSLRAARIANVANSNFYCILLNSFSARPLHPVIVASAFVSYQMENG